MTYLTFCSVNGIYCFQAKLLTNHRLLGIKHCGGFTLLMDGSFNTFNLLFTELPFMKQVNYFLLIHKELISKTHHMFGEFVINLITPQGSSQFLQVFH